MDDYYQPKNPSSAAQGPALGLRDSASGQIYPIRNGLFVGRAHAEISLIDQPTVSRLHGEFRVDDSMTLFAQADVRHPARHNGEAIGSGCAIVLRAGDRLEFGLREFTIVQLSVLRGELEPDVSSDPVVHQEGELETHFATPQAASVQEVAEGRGGALVLLVALVLGAAAIWHAITFVESAPPEMLTWLWLSAAACALAPLLLARVVWSATLPRLGAHPAKFAVIFLLMIAGLECALPEWLDMTTGVFSRGQGMGLAKACAGDSLRSGPCADLYESCGPRCRHYALPLLASAAPLDDAIEKARAMKSDAAATAAPPAPAATAPAAAPAAAPPLFPESNIVSTLVDAPPRKTPTKKRPKSALKALRRAPPTRLPAKRRGSSSTLQPSEVDPADDAAYEPL